MLNDVWGFALEICFKSCEQFQREFSCGNFFVALTKIYGTRLNTVNTVNQKQYLKKKSLFFFSHVSKVLKLFHKLFKLFTVHNFRAPSQVEPSSHKFCPRTPS